MDFLVRIFDTVALFYLPPAALVIGLLRMRKNYEAAAREPFTELPIRLAGQSTREKADTMWESAMDRLLFVLLGSPLLGLLSVLLPFPNPHLTRIILFTAVIIGVAVVGFQIFGLVRKSWQ